MYKLILVLGNKHHEKQNSDYNSLVKYAAMYRGCVGWSIKFIKEA